MNKIEQLIRESLIVERKSDEQWISLATDLYLKILKDSRKTTPDSFTVLRDGDNIAGIGIEIYKIQPRYRDLVVEIIELGDSPAFYQKDETGNGIITINPLNGGEDSEKIWKKSKELINDQDEYFSYLLDNIVKIIPKTYFVHELVHYFDDKYNYTFDSGADSDSLIRSGGDRLYFNSFEEINAYLIAGLQDYRNDIKRGKYKTFNQFKDSFIDYIYDDNWNLITDENKRRIIKRLYDFWQNR